MKLFAAALLTALLASTATAEVSIPYVAADQIELDGQTADWSDLLGPPLLTAADFRGTLSQGTFKKPLALEYDPDNLDFRIWLGWSEPGRIFVAAEFQDDYVRDDVRGIFHQADGMVIAVTPDSRDKTHTYAVRPAGNILAPYTIVGSGAARWSVWDPFARAARAGPTDTSWGVEFYLSCFDVLLPSNEGDNRAAKESVITDLAAGDRIDLELYVVDWDVHNSHIGYYHLAPEGTYSVRALLLSPGETAVRKQTWGQVKALP